MSQSYGKPTPGWGQIPSQTFVPYSSGYSISGSNHNPMNSSFSTTNTPRSLPSTSGRTYVPNTPVVSQSTPLQRLMGTPK